MSGVAREKFVPILRLGTYEVGADCAIPPHFSGIATVDFRDDASFGASFEQLLRVFFDIPEVAPPPLGTPPRLSTQQETRLRESTPPANVKLDDTSPSETVADNREKVARTQRRKKSSPSKTISGKQPDKKALPKGLISRDGKIWNEIDGAEMVLIPAGEFEMGTDPNEIPELVKWAKRWYDVKPGWFEDETPRHTVNLDAFYLDVYPVTNAQYRQFVQATGYKEPEGDRWDGKEWKPGFEPWKDSRFNGDNQPVVCVTWHDAMAYCEWAGKRLPTEAEWEKAARGGLVGKRFPWGDEDPNGTQCNFADKNTNFDWSDKNADDGYQYTSPVGTYLPNGYGLYDMAGNVWEWCLDEFQADFYKTSPRDNPLAGEKMEDVIKNFTTVKTLRVFRGGGWDIDPSVVRVANRYNNSSNPTLSYITLGFRCAVRLNKLSSNGD